LHRCSSFWKKPGILVYHQGAKYANERETGSTCEAFPHEKQVDTEQQEDRIRIWYVSNEIATATYNFVSIQDDLGTPQAKLNQRLTIWWDLPFNKFQEEIVKVFKHDIP